MSSLEDTPALSALKQSLDDLRAVCDVLDEKYTEALNAYQQQQQQQQQQQVGEQQQQQQQEDDKKAVEATLMEADD
ncbi:hypothetical protein EPH_0052960 [Eimeria praecox]|uniref:Uncharacterized protein n=1 Tax=Eimeria praecox TaxID=51316 RepID=U6GNE5_9EIME|nr:hypothetical protein EPH_0052960 [Eimeria praecox]